MKKSDALYLTLMNGTWLILLLEHIVLNLELALPLATMWGIGTLLFNIRVLLKYAVTVSYET